MAEREPSRLHGFIDGVVERHVFGWVLDPDEPRRRLTVSGEIDGRPLGSVEASEPRSDLEQAGIGDGSSGFRLPLRGSLSAGEHELSVVVYPGREPLALSDDWVVLDDEGSALPEVMLRGAAPRASIESGVLAETQRPARPYPATDLSSPGSAVLGEAGWLFERPSVGFDRLRGFARPSHGRLDRLVAEIETLHLDSKEAGAASFVACLPDKLHVYPEHLPAGLSLDPAGRTAALVAARLRDREVDVLDLLAALMDARAHGRLFPRTGTYVTWTGAFHAYRALVKVVMGTRPGTTGPLAAGALDLGPLTDVSSALVGAPKLAWIGEGLIEVTGVADPGPQDREPALGDAMALGAVPAGAAGTDGERWERPDRPEFPSAVVVTDPAGRRVARFLAEQFSRCVVVSAPAVSAQLVRSHWPDIVIQLTSDRTLDAMLGRDEPPRA